MVSALDQYRPKYRYLHPVQDTIVAVVVVVVVAAALPTAAAFVRAILIISTVSSESLVLSCLAYFEF
jgi:hypothetical protein